MNHQRVAALPLPLTIKNLELRIKRGGFYDKERNVEVDAADYSVSDYGYSHSTGNYQLYGYLANGMHLKALALILQKITRAGD